MSAPAAMQGDYVDLKFLKSRKVIQIWIELPIEAGAQFVAAFGTPDPSTTIPVAIARIDTAPKVERKAGGRIAQRAGIISNEGSFKKFIEDKYLQGPSEDPASFIRTYCGVKSRADLDHDERAGFAFSNLDRAYTAWMEVPW
jgi:hypothetical protein